MDDPATATAKAVEATANATGKALDVVHDTGGYLGRVFADVPANLVGVLGGVWLNERHIRLRDAMRRRTEQILHDRDVREAVELSPNIAAALVAGAQEEARDELMDLWARLLANAMDPSMNSVRGPFIDAVKNMDPTDALVLKFLYERKLSFLLRGGEDPPQATNFQQLADAIRRNADDVEVSVRHLSSMGFFDPGLNANPPDRWFLNPISRQFMRACYPEIER